MADCLFCRIVAGEIPADVVHDSPRFLGFRDIDPKAPTHMLVIPKGHVASLNEAEDEALVGGLLQVAREVAAAEGISASGYRVVLNTNADGGQTVFHLHAHVLGGRAMGWPPG